MDMEKSLQEYEPTYLDDSNLTDSVDWRTYGAVNPVQH
jgi:hypothetical protein